MLFLTGRSRRCRRALMTMLGGVALVLVFLLIPAGGPPSALAATLTTPYVATTVQAGQSVTFGLALTDAVAERWDVSVNGTPSGWKATLLGGGRPVTAIMSDGTSPFGFQLQVDIPADAAEGTSTLTVVARSAGRSLSVPISLTISQVEGGTSTLEPDYRSVRGPAGATYTFSLTLKNGSEETRAYNLSATGPDNWTLSLKPSGATQETPTVSVGPNASQVLNFQVTPAPSVEIGTYDLNVTAAGGGESVSIPLQVEITGTYSLTLATPDGTLNANVKAGSATRVQFLVTNTGTGPLQGVELGATAPANWDVSFLPGSIDLLAAGEEQTVTVVFTPAKDAIAGDYVVTLTAQADQATTQSAIRVTVKTSTLWGVVGGLIALAAIVILGLVFWRFGHR